MESNKVAQIFIVCFIALIAIIGFTMESCEKNQKEQIPQDSVPAEIIRITEFGYDGHDYIEFVTRGGKCTVVHSPDCHCLDDAKDVINQMQTEFYD